MHVKACLPICGEASDCHQGSDEVRCTQGGAGRVLPSGSHSGSRMPIAVAPQETSVHLLTEKPDQSKGNIEEVLRHPPNSPSPLHFVCHWVIGLIVKIAADWTMSFRVVEIWWVDADNPCMRSKDILWRHLTLPAMAVCFQSPASRLDDGRTPVANYPALKST